jgi:hypothetical protein
VEYGNWLAGNYTLGNESLMSVKFCLFKKLSGLPLGRTDPLLYAIRKQSSLLFWRHIVLYYDTAHALSCRSLSSIIRLFKVERNMCFRSENWVTKMLFTCILDLETGFLKMLLKFWHLHRYVNN